MSRAERRRAEREQKKKEKVQGGGSKPPHDSREEIMARARAWASSDAAKEAFGPGFIPEIIMLLKQRGFSSVDELVNLEAKEFAARIDVEGNTPDIIRDEFRIVSNGLFLQGFCNAPIVEYSAKLQLYKQLEEMHTLNLDKSVKKMGRNKFTKMSLAECLYHTFFYRDFLLKMPRDARGEEQVYYIEIPNMKINEGLEGLKISSFTIGEECLDEKGDWMHAGLNLIDLSNSGAVVDVGNMYYLQAGKTGDIIQYIVSFNECSLHGCEVIGRLFVSDEPIRGEDDIPKIYDVIESKGLPDEYRKRVKEFHVGTDGHILLDNIPKILDDIASGKKPKGVRTPINKNLIDWDLSDFGSRFDPRIVDYLRKNKIPYSFKNEALKNRYIGECLYRTVAGKWGFEFNKRDVLSKLVGNAEMMSEVNPTAQAYAFRAAALRNDYKFLTIGWCGTDLIDGENVKISSEDMQRVQDLCVKKMQGIKSKHWFEKGISQVKGEYVDCPDYTEKERVEGIHLKAADEVRNFFDRFAISDDVRDMMKKLTPLVIVDNLDAQLKMEEVLQSLQRHDNVKMINLV